MRFKKQVLSLATILALAMILCLANVVPGFATSSTSANDIISIENLSENVELLPATVPINAHFNEKWQLFGLNDLVYIEKEVGGRIALRAHYYTSRHAIVGTANPVEYYVPPTGDIAAYSTCPNSHAAGPCANVSCIDGRILTGVLATNNRVAFQWYVSDEPTNDPAKATPIAYEVSIDFIPDTSAAFLGTKYYFVVLTHTSGTVTNNHYSTPVKITITPFGSSSDYPANLITPAEASGWRRTTNSAEVFDYCGVVAEASNGRIRREIGGYTLGRAAIPEGVISPSMPILHRPSAPQPIPMLIIGYPTAPNDLAEVRSANKEVVYINANIHSGEVEGKEAMLIFAREVAMGEHDDLLKDLVIVITPNINADGNDYLYAQRNNSQYFPKLVGSRATMAVLNPTLSATNYRPTNETDNWYNVNRDMTKLDSPEGRLLAKIMTQWDPVSFMDLHATNGVVNRHATSWNWGLHPDTDPAIMEYNRTDFYDKALGKDSYMWKVQGKSVSPYSASVTTSGTHGDSGLVAGPLQSGNAQWRSFEDYPRYTTNYIGLRNRIAVLTEVYSHDPYPVRVCTQYATAMGTLQATQIDKAKIRQLINDADNYARNRAIDGLDPARDFVTLSSYMDYLEDMTLETYLGGAGAPLSSTITDGQTTVGANTTTDRVGTLLAGRADYKVKYIGKWTPRNTNTLMGAYYLLDSDCEEVVALLDLHGIKYGKISAPITLSEDALQWYRATRRNRNMTWYEGHQMNRFEGSWVNVTEGVSIPAGTYVVSTAQPLGALAALLLEPAAIDGAVSWSFFNDRFNTDNPATIRSKFPSQASDGVVGIPIFKVTDYISLPISVKVTFNVDGVNYFETQAPIGLPITAPDAPYKFGYIFVGWTVQGALFDFDTPITESIVLDAKWKLIPISVLRITTAGVPAPAMVTLPRNSTAQFGVVVNSDALPLGVVWSTSNEAFASVDAAGKVTVKAFVGTAVLTATAPSGVTHSVILRIT